MTNTTNTPAARIPVSLRGMATLNLWADDLDAARAWYTEILGLEPYFVRDGYIEWRIGDDEDELGIIDRRFGGPASPLPGGAMLLWHVDDLDATFAALIAQGASVHMPIMDRTEDFRTGAVVDPFGNVLGLMQNPHWAGKH